MSDHGTWRGITVRDKSGRLGKVIADTNGWLIRLLDIRFDGGDEYTLKLNNVNANPPDPLEIEWEYNPGKWGLIST